MPINCGRYKYMLQDFWEVTLQTTQQEVMSEQQVILYYRVVISMVSMVQNDRKYMIYIYHIIKQLCSVDMNCY